jgi:hypothetical protein
MLGWIREKMATLELAPRGGKFFVFDSTTIGNDTSACNNPCALGGDCSTATGNGSWDNTHTSNPFSRGKRLGEEPSTLVQRAQRTNGSSDG